MVSERARHTGQHGHCLLVQQAQHLLVAVGRQQVPQAGPAVSLSSVVRGLRAILCCTAQQLNSCSGSALHAAALVSLLAWRELWLDSCWANHLQQRVTGCPGIAAHAAPDLGHQARLHTASEHADQLLQLGRAA